MAIDHCPTCGRPITTPVKAYRAQRLKHDPVPGCHWCRYLRRLPIPLEGNRLGKILYERIRNEGPSLANWSVAHALSPTVVRQVLVGDRRDARGRRIGRVNIARSTAEKFAAAFGVTTEQVLSWLPKSADGTPTTADVIHSEQGRASQAAAVAAIRGRPWSKDRRRRYDEGDSHEGFRSVWARRRGSMVAKAQQSISRIDKTVPSFRAAHLYGVWKQRHQGPPTPAMLDLAADRYAKPYVQGGLPRLYLRYRFYERAGAKWPGFHPPDIRRFDAVEPLKRQGRTWRQIAYLLGVDPQSLRIWWQRFWSL